MILNLDKNFWPLGDTHVHLPFKNFIFPGGEIGFKLLGDPVPDVIISTRLSSSDRIMELLMATDALRRAGAQRISLICPYIPYARQDRVMVPGESLSLKVFANLINTQKYHKIICYDIHNETTLALFDNIENVSNHKFVHKVLEGKRNYWIVSPDAGALKKIYGVTKYLSMCGSDYNGVVLCDKRRNLQNGNIEAFEVRAEDLDGRDCYIIDDLVDGGATFVTLAKELRKKNCGKVFLVASHGIFSRGYRLEGIDHCFTTDSFKDIDAFEDVTQIRLQHVL